MNQKQEGYLATLENYKHEAEIQRDKFLVSFSGVALGLSITLATTHKENNPALGLAVLLFTGAVTTITLSYATSILSQKRKMRLFKAGENSAQETWEKITEGLNTAAMLCFISGIIGLAYSIPKL